MQGIKQTATALVIVGVAMAGIGCSSHTATPPGPGPTAVPNSYNGTQIQPGGPINAEPRMGAAAGGGMHDQSH